MGREPKDWRSRRPPTRPPQTACIPALAEREGESERESVGPHPTTAATVLGGRCVRRQGHMVVLRSRVVI